METIDKNALAEELNKVAEKYGIKNCAFCGETDNEYVGLLALKPISFSELSLVSQNIARLYQCTRERLLCGLERIAKI